MTVPALANPVKTPDAWGAATSAIVAILGATGVMARLELTADQVAIILGSIATLLATFRELGRRWLASRGQ